MDIAIGSNHLRNTNGVFQADGQDVIKVEFAQEDPLLLSMELFNPAGTPVAKLERNTWTSNDQDRFELQIEPNSVMLVDKTLKGVVILVKKDGETGVTVPQAKFYLPGGKVSEVTEERWHVGNTLELKGADVDMMGGAIEIE